MNKIIILRSISILALGLLLAGCETVTDIGFPPHEPKLVVNGLFRAGSSWHIGLTRTIPITQDLGDFENDLERVEITILREGAVVARLHACGDGDAFCAEGSPEPGVAYALEATAEGFNTVRATTRVPAAVEYTVKEIADDDLPESHTLQISLDDPPGPSYYMFYVQQTRIHEAPEDTSIFTLRYGFETVDPFLLRNNPDYGFVLQAVPRFDTVLFEDGDYDGEMIDFTINGRFSKNDCENCGGLPREYAVVLVTLSEPYYRYMREYLRKTSSRIELPVQSSAAIFSNVKGGVGIFAGANAVRKPIL